MLGFADVSVKSTSVGNTLVLTKLSWFIRSMRVHLMFWGFLMLVSGLVQCVPCYAMMALFISFYKRDKISVVKWIVSTTP